MIKYKLKIYKSSLGFVYWCMTVKKKKKKKSVESQRWRYYGKLYERWQNDKTWSFIIRNEYKTTYQLLAMFIWLRGICFQPECLETSDDFPSTVLLKPWSAEATVRFFTSSLWEIFLLNLHHPLFQHKITNSKWFI